MNAMLKTGVAALALTVGLGIGAMGANAQTSTSGAQATDSATGATSGAMKNNSGTSDTSSGAATSGTMQSGTTAGGSGMAMDKASFAAQAESSNMFEIESSKLAEKQAKSANVKKFAEMMIKDHTKAGKSMEAVLKKDGMQPKMALSSKHEAMLQQLESAKGAEFDQAYITAQTQAHQEAVTLFKSYSAHPDDKALGSFAKKTLPTLQMHLQHVEKLSASK